MKTRYLILMASVAIFTDNAIAGTDTTHCSQYCAEGATCDCDWDESTNTLTINSGTFRNYNPKNPSITYYTSYGAFHNADYNINIAGDNITFTGHGAFFRTTGKITYSGNNASFESCAFCDAEGDIFFTGKDASFMGQHAFSFTAGDIILSPGSIKLLEDHGSSDFSDRGNKGGQIFCTSDPTECADMFKTVGRSTYLTNSQKYKKYSSYSEYMHQKAVASVESARTFTARYTTDELGLVLNDDTNSLTFYFK